MKCEAARRHIEDLHEGKLDAALSDRIKAHLESCAACRREVDLLGAEARLYEVYGANLARRLSSESELWEKVSARLRSAGQLPSVGKLPAWLEYLVRPLSARRLAYALALVLLSVGGTLATLNILENREPGTASRVTGDRDLESALRSIARAEQEYQAAIRLLSGILERRKPTLDRELVADLERNLRSIDESIAATRLAFKEHPSDPELALYMLAAYAKKVELLQEIAS